MPTLSEAQGQDLSGYEPVAPSELPTEKPSFDTAQYDPSYNTMVRCPMPPIFESFSDNLRQFYTGGQVPQNRVFSPPLSPSTSGGGTGGGGVALGGGSSSGGGSGFVQPSVQQSSITTTPLNPGQTFVNSFLVAKGFQLLNVSVNSPARVELYGTSLAQIGDSSRGLDTPTPAGIVQNIICDVALDTSPFQWSFQDRVGANADSPQTTTIYVTITNLDTLTDTITLTLTYVPLET